MIQDQKKGLVARGLFAASVLVALTPSAWAAQERVDFESQIRPLFESRCYRCHGSRTDESDFRVDSRDHFFAGGKSRRAPVEPGNGVGSFLFEVVSGTSEDWPRMPPIGEPLADEEIAALRDWIDQGAEWPDDAATARKHWAYTTPEWPEVPSESDTEWARNPIDAFVLARLEGEGLDPSPPAEPERLLRRASLDLIGLPPSPEVTAAFLSDVEGRGLDRAYDRFIQRLLASPSYGERWAQLWLDLARYADSNGYEKDSAREIWPWRDWVIAALNRDQPFDQFAIEQLAGDLLPGATLEQKIATGFLRNSMVNEEGGIDPEEFHYEAIIDRLTTTATVFLGTTVGCARCHDHKFDPISQKEFFGLLAVFNSQVGDHRSVNSYTHLSGGPTVRVPDAAQRAHLASLKHAVTELHRTLDSSAEERAQARATFWARVLERPGRAPITMVVEELDAPRVTRLHRGGNFRTLGEIVSPSIPAVLPGPPTAQGKGGSPRLDRLAFARWLVSPENPLTTRVTVNRVWEQYFGTGLVETTEDFGTQGSRPSHPELLDWLALHFQWQGWSLKSLHRTIVTSSTYRQSAQIRPELLQRDPQNRLLARGPRFRLPAETIRDQALAASGLLSSKTGGPSVFPYQPPRVWNMPYSSARWRESAGEDRYRRGLYTWWQRSATYPAFVNFDAPSRELTCSRRDRTNTPLQALTTLNDPVFFEAARALGERVLRHTDPAARLELAFRLVLVRPPDAAEKQRLEEFLRQQLEQFSHDEAAARAVLSNHTGEEAPAQPPSSEGAAELAAWTMLSNVLLNLDEALNKS